MKAISELVTVGVRLSVAPGSVRAMWELLAKSAVVLVCAMAAMLGNPVIRGLLRRIDRHVDDEDVELARQNLGLAQAERQMPGGRWIGVLERVAVFACIVAGFPAGIAIVLGVKGLGRYAELATGDARSRRGELFIIGTFASMLWAAAFAGIAYAVLWQLRDTS